MLPLHQLLAFTELAKCGSFTLAARQLGVSTASVSRAVASLEDEMGVRLFNRTTRHLNLTEEGRVFYESVQAGLDRLDDAASRLGALRTDAVGTLHISMPESVCKTYVLGKLPAFLARYPRVRLDIALHDHPVDLLTGGFELSVQIGRPIESGYVIRRLGRVPIALVASPGYLAAHGVPVTPQDLCKHECVGLRLASRKPIIWHFENWSINTDDFLPASMGNRVTLSHQFDPIVDAALAGLGITAAAVPVVMKYLQAGTLKLVLTDFPLKFSGDDTDLFVLYPHREYLPPRVRAFVDFLFECVREGTPRVDLEQFAARPSRSNASEPINRGSTGLSNTLHT